MANAGLSCRTQSGPTISSNKLYQASSAVFDGQFDTVTPWPTVQLCEGLSLYGPSDNQIDASFNVANTS